VTNIGLNKIFWRLWRDQHQTDGISVPADTTQNIISI